MAFMAVVPLTVNALTPVMSPPTKSLPVTFMLKPEPVTVEPDVVIKFEPVRFVLAPSVTAPA